MKTSKVNGVRGKGKTMLALSIRQPWAWLILHAGKDIENRSWPTRYRGEFLIHAGKQWDIRPTEWEWEFDEEVWRLMDPEAIKRGGIVGRAEIVDCVTQSDSDWFGGPYGFVIKNARPVPFVSCKGRLGFFASSYPGNTT